MTTEETTTSTTGPTAPQFPFEKYLSHPLPDYEYEWNLIIIKIIITSVFFLLILPNILKYIYEKPLPVQVTCSAAVDESNQTQNESLNQSNRKGKKSTLSKSKSSSSSSSSSLPSSSKVVNVITTRTSTTTIINGNSKNERRSKTNKIKTATTSTISYSESNKTTKTGAETETKTESSHVPTIILIISNTFYILILFTFIATSPNNITTSRRVYQAPILKKSECQFIIDMAQRAAERNVISAQKELDSIQEQEHPQKEQLEKLLRWPNGWKKDRHESYPTTDLNVVLDFVKEDLEYIAQLLNARLSPLLSRIYGISQDSIRANDMFVVRYDGEGEGAQQSLNAHTDSSHVSFNILLNDEFEGGGTRFYDRLRGTTYDAKPKPGDVLINNAMVQHEGLATTKGTRYIFVGFMNIDAVDPWNGQKTKVPYYSTYLSFPWITVLLKGNLFDDILVENDDNDGDNSVNDNKIGSSNQENRADNRSSGGALSQAQKFDLVFMATLLTTSLGDRFAPHGLVKLIQKGKKKEYIHALEKHYRDYGDYMDKAVWFKGQQIYINLDGSYAAAVSNGMNQSIN
jgi:cytoskeletal protein RodZ